MTALVLSAAGCSGGKDSPDAADSGSMAPDTVTTSTGTYRGSTTDHARVFRGIRYAQAPTGDRRWTLPRAATAPKGVRQATKAGPGCAQAAGSKTSGSEDCLFLDVTTPRDTKKGEKLPVMVWWHGGGYTSGAGSEYDAQRLADQGRVMVVTANYRLGAFGYYGLDGLKGAGTFGLADQIESLRWAKRNAGGFGGDADNITVFGQSAGGMSTCALLTAPEARGLVDKAAVMSGSCALDWPTGALFPGTPPQTPYIALAKNRAESAAAAKKLGCTGDDRLACLRKLPTEKIVALGQAFSDHLSYATPLLPVDPATALAKGDVAKVPVISGGTANEARSFVAGAVAADPHAVTARTYPRLLAAAFGKQDAKRVAETYPLSRFDSAALAWAAVVTDSSWSCPTERANRELARHTTVYAYEFADPDAPDVNQLASAGVPLGATHATDMPYLFDLLGKDLLRGDAQHTLSKDMIAYWSSFAHTGKPKSTAGEWSPKLAAGGQALSLAPAKVRPVDVAAEHHCDFWQDVKG
ncbi:carboxylesterase/lipase family protein [Streptomyces sp. NPDC050560]|uniref:carboxylesterase/lipase family protein n=1 Tax=Streptomyces sp. NPDC050560 TaxID=3365630 RepID=UPI0037B883C8